MKFIIALFALVAVAAATDVPILKQTQDVGHDGNFHFEFETGDGTYHTAQGDANSVHGSFKYSSPDGTPVDLTYTADENGYQPSGSHVPAIPEAIARALEYIRAHPPKDAEHGAYVE